MKRKETDEKVTEGNAQEQYEIHQKKRTTTSRKFREKALPIKSLRVSKPFVKVIKKYGRFNKVAKEKGWLKNPVPKDDDDDGEYFEVYDITSGGVMRELSPMVLGPVIDDDKEVLGYNIEDVWQGLKVSSMHTNGGTFDPKASLLWINGEEAIDPNPSDSDEWMDEWSKWSKCIRFSGEGLRHRIKLDKDKANPNATLFSFYKGKRLPYHEARKVMYIPWYAKLARETNAYKYLKKRFDAGTSLILLDTDGEARDADIPELSESSLRKRVNDKDEIFGHGFVLASMLLGCDVWSDKGS